MEDMSTVVISKKWYASKTLWVNLIAIIAMIAQSVTGNQILDTDTQSALLALINIALRLITKTSII